MYRKILVALDTTPSDQALLEHLAPFAVLVKAEVLLLHVADGWVARNFDQLNLAESEEMKSDWNYLQETAARLRTETGLTIGTQLALGSPPAQILQVAEQENCDLIAFASHAHLIKRLFVEEAPETTSRHAQFPFSNLHFSIS